MIARGMYEYPLHGQMLVFAIALTVAGCGPTRGPAVPWELQDQAVISDLSPAIRTWGYGDILPANGAARSLAILEMLSGQLYLAAFVARLVGVMGVALTAPQDELSDATGL